MRIFDIYSEVDLSQVSEVKCVHCKEWTLWRGHIDDRCLYCGQFLDPQRFSREVERKIRSEIVAEKDWFFIAENDGPFKRHIKQYLNSVRWWIYYAQVAFFGFVSVVLLLISLLSG